MDFQLKGTLDEETLAGQFDRLIGDLFDDILSSDISYNELVERVALRIFSNHYKIRE